MTDYLTLPELLAIHADQISRYGGISGIRDYGLLASALYRPQTGYYVGLVEEAAALWESLAQNHAFLDGDKRAAFAATYVFLIINGAQFTASGRETFRFISSLYATGTFNFEKLVAFLHRHVVTGQ